MWLCLAAVPLLGGCGDSLVGGQCAAGYLEKNGGCVAPPGPGADGWYNSGGAGGDGVGADIGGSDSRGGSGHAGGSGATGGSGRGAAGSGGSGEGGAAQCDPPLIACSDG